MTFRHFLSWKPLFYETLLPALRLLGPSPADAALGALGRTLATAWPPRRAELERSLSRLPTNLGDADAIASVRKGLEANVLRYLARDCLLDGLSEADFFGLFDVQGLEHLNKALAGGQGAILLGSHLGAHLASTHWLFRRGLPVRLLLQRAQHVSRLIKARYDVTTGPHPQSGFFLRRNMTPHEAAIRIFRTRSALRDGLIVYMKGDVPWSDANTRPARFLGQERTFQSLWAEFSAIFGTPVVPVFCTHRPQGRYALSFDPAFNVEPGEEGQAVSRYLARLESEILAHPADAVGHLLWPCYGPEAAAARKRPARAAKIKTRTVTA